MSSLPLLLVRRAMVGVELLPLDERADVYEAAAICLAATDPAKAVAASETAAQLREASALQLSFSHLLNSDQQ